MRTLYHFPLHPPSRMARITLAEKKLKVRETVVNPWELEPEFIELTAEAMPPVLIDLTQHGTLTIILREGRTHLADHLEYMTSLLEKRDWLAGRRYSLGDIAAAAHLSCLDFLGEVSWRDYPTLKAWYQPLWRGWLKPPFADHIPEIYGLMQNLP